MRKIKYLLALINIPRFLIHYILLGVFYKECKDDINVAYSVSRGGTGSQYSFYLKNLLIYLIIRFFILHRNKYNQI